MLEYHPPLLTYHSSVTEDSSCCRSRAATPFKQTTGLPSCWVLHFDVHYLRNFFGDLNRPSFDVSSESSFFGFSLHKRTRIYNWWELIALNSPQWPVINSNRRQFSLSVTFASGSGFRTLSSRQSNQVLVRLHSNATSYRADYKHNTLEEVLSLFEFSRRECVYWHLVTTMKDPRFWLLESYVPYQSTF